MPAPEAAREEGVVGGSSSAAPLCARMAGQGHWSERELGEALFFLLMCGNLAPINSFAKLCAWTCYLGAYLVAYAEVARGAT